MAVLIRCPLVGCNKINGWQYPNFEWARAHVPGLPPRCFVIQRPEHDLAALLVVDRVCPDPVGHANQFLSSRGLPVIPLSASAPLQSSDEPDVAPIEDDDFPF